MCFVELKMDELEELFTKYCKVWFVREQRSSTLMYKVFVRQIIPEPTTMAFVYIFLNCIK